MRFFIDRRIITSDNSIRVRVEGTATIPSFPLPLLKHLGKQRIKPQTPKLISLVILNSSRSL